MKLASKIARDFIASNLTDHAFEELKRAGLFDKDSDYSGELGKNVLALVELFSKQGHSGFSAAMARELFNKLSDFKVLTPISGNPSEWNDVSEFVGRHCWQSKRDPSLFSEDDGQNWYSINE
jgi:hypothetical protein